MQLDDYKANGPHHGDISTLLEYLHSQQKGHGGWGYAEKTSGDTSMTQYGVLSAWEAKQAGFSVSPDAMERAANWLLSTQDPSGGYGYQGELRRTGEAGAAERRQTQHDGGRPGKPLYLRPFFQTDRAACQETAEGGRYCRRA